MLKPVCGPICLSDPPVVLFVHGEYTGLTRSEVSSLSKYTIAIVLTVVLTSGKVSRIESFVVVPFWRGGGHRRELGKLGI